MVKKPFVLGVCGKIASGKSTVLSVFKKHGWFTIDADKIVHELYKSGMPGQRRISDFFGEEFMKKDGSVNRVKLRGVVFDNAKKLNILNRLIHPLVLAEVLKILSNSRDVKNVTLEAIYFEDKIFDKVIDKILIVERPISAIKKELIFGRGLSAKVTDAILKSQILPKKVDAKIRNNSTLKALEKKAIMAAWKWKQ